MMAADREYDSLIENDTWDLVELPAGRKTVGCRWVFKVKYKNNGQVERFKARLVAKGYTQRYGIDYDETFSPVVRFASIRTVLAVALEKNMIIHQMDVETAFLNGLLNEDIYMVQPEGYAISGKENLVCKLKKSLYGLKQSPRCWNTVLNQYLESIGFKSCDADPCVYVRCSSNGLFIIAVYVDDLILAAESSTELLEVKRSFSSQFRMKDMGELHYCLGVSIEQNRENSRILLHQNQYILGMLERYGLSDATTYATPSDTNVKLKKDCANSNAVDVSKYQSMVGSLLYAAMATRPDIAYAVSCVSKFNSSPTKTHMTALKRIFQYLKYSSNLALKLEKSGKGLLCYSDADWAGDQDDRHSTTGNVFMLGGGAISWISKKQSVVALSTAEAEYIALSSATQEVIWLRRLLTDLHLPENGPTKIWEDNQGAIAISKNPVAHGRTKHIDIRHHFVREAVCNKVVDVKYCPTEVMVADIFTKALPRDRFERLRGQIGLICY